MNIKHVKVIQLDRLYTRIWETEIQEFKKEEKEKCFTEIEKAYSDRNSNHYKNNERFEWAVNVINKRFNNEWQSSYKDIPVDKSQVEAFKNHLLYIEWADGNEIYNRYLVEFEDALEQGIDIDPSLIEAREEFTDVSLMAVEPNKGDRYAGKYPDGRMRAKHTYKSHNQHWVNGVMDGTVWVSQDTRSEVFYIKSFSFLKQAEQAKEEKEPNDWNSMMYGTEAKEETNEAELWKELIDLYDTADKNSYGYGTLINVLKNQFTIKRKQP